MKLPEGPVILCQNIQKVINPQRDVICGNSYVLSKINRYFGYHFYTSEYKLSQKYPGMIRIDILS
ncbi:Uncharacterized protein XB16_0267 [Leptospira santarosai]|uniref:Uncharacterized protein n=1 Tax=Leptospira santarosai TaxID=28183 RepID=A0A2P1QNY9_9LEPT|nr:Uncharacterized protein XB16_0267 [Leptospira santarosai]